MKKNKTPPKQKVGSAREGSVFARIGQFRASHKMPVNTSAKELINEGRKH